MVHAREHCGEETSCVPTKVLVISFARPLIGDIKWSGIILDSLFDLLGMNSIAPNLHRQRKQLAQYAHSFSSFALFSAVGMMTSTVKSAALF
jgi:hypothetical protein